MSKPEVREGSIVRSRFNENVWVNGDLVDVPAGSLAVVDQVISGGWGVIAYFQGFDPEDTTYLNFSECEWVSDPEPEYPVQRVCDGACQH